MTWLIVRGERPVGRFSIDPYEYQYDGDSDAVAQVLAAGPEAEAFTGAAPPDDVSDEVNADDLRELSPEEQAARLSSTLRSFGLRVID